MVREMSDSICNKFMSSKNNFLYRESVAWITSHAYVGTNSNEAYEKLLYLIENDDEDDDVKGAACIFIATIIKMNFGNQKSFRCCFRNFITYV